MQRDRLAQRAPILSSAFSRLRRVTYPEREARASAEDPSGKSLTERHLHFIRSGRERV